MLQVSARLSVPQAMIGDRWIDRRAKANVHCYLCITNYRNIPCDRLRQFVFTKVIKFSVRNIENPPRFFFHLFSDAAYSVPPYLSSLCVVQKVPQKRQYIWRENDYA